MSFPSVLPGLTLFLHGCIKSAVMMVLGDVIRSLLSCAQCCHTCRVCDSYRSEPSGSTCRLQAKLCSVSSNEERVKASRRKVDEQVSHESSSECQTWVRGPELTLEAKDLVPFNALSQWHSVTKYVTA